MQGLLSLQLLGATLTLTVSVSWQVTFVPRSVTRTFAVVVADSTTFMQLVGA